ncbi:hypothetical protein RG47T_0198 [Mucilaginibacter polytrichastri]|uniref:Uncharacterized protein n=1 Tax=Mucilaginibacter polytrichastri TaxID=1302689 RepID=A0A1Q5ZSL6_9SPHI|nr:hypothetical protein RG47T_0198 [Mucilaginibacter polytrichastri]
MGYLYISQAYNMPASRQGKNHQPEIVPHVTENKNSISVNSNMLFLFFKRNVC